MSRTTNPPASRTQRQTHPDLESLTPLVGTWKISGDAHGQIRYEWADGGFFLMQHVDLAYAGRTIKGIEVIGHLQGIGQQPSQDIHSRFYSFTDGLTLDYVYELAGDIFTIWFGPKGSNNRFQGKFSKDGNTFTGGWRWPGGGYDIEGIRIIS
ncbi:MAG: hypothetical protein WAL08_12680 [Candidatus Sulfotelmatobacter sp.]